MTTGLDKITRKLRARREALLLAYDPRDLHKLRINIRRARSLLKASDDERLESLRNRWGTIGKQTNAARDWDTLVAYARTTLPDHQWRELQTLLEPRLAQARENALTTLQSWQWQDAMHDWERLAEASTLANPLPSAIAPAKRNPAKRVLKRGERALAARDERSWHMFRIAVKNLRYTLESKPPHRKHRKRHEAVAKTCKRLQDELGMWHDTVVHLTLLDTLNGDSQLAENPRALAALHQLRTSIEARREKALAKVKRTVERDADTLKAAVGLFGT